MNEVKRIYVIGPYTKGDVAINTRKAILAGDQIAAMGAYPFIPHLLHFWHLLCPHDYHFWLAQDLAWLDVCHAAFRLKGESNGGDDEEMQMKAQDKPVFYNMEDLRKWLEESPG